MEDKFYNNKIPKISEPDVAKKFAEKMHDISVDSGEKEAMAKASLGNWQYIDLKGFPISPEALVLVSQETAQKLKVICFYWSTQDIRIAAVNPSSPAVNQIVSKLKEDYRGNVKIYLISPNSFLNAYKLYDNIPKIRKEVWVFKKRIK